MLVSSGTLLAAIAIGDTALTGAALYYLVVSTLALSALFLLVELVERGRRPGADVLAVTAEAFGSGDDEGDESHVGAAIPGGSRASRCRASPRARSCWRACRRLRASSASSRCWMRCSSPTRSRRRRGQWLRC